MDMSRMTFGATLVAVISCGISAMAAEVPLAEPYLLEGKLAAGVTAMETRLKATPADDQARFGLGVLQFFQTFEHLGAALHRQGLRTEKSFLRPPTQVKEFLPQNPAPETATYTTTRQMVQTFVDDLARVEATLSQVKDPAVTLPLHVGLIRIDPFGQGKPIHAAFLLSRLELNSPDDIEQAKTLVINFDRGDVCWLRGYCRFLAVAGELLLAIDGQHAFECTAHLFFEKVETPHTFLLENRQAVDDAPFDNFPAISDVLSFFHQLLNLPIGEPARMKAALTHFEAGVAQAKEMWTFILKETDDDREWIPNPKQTGVVGVKVTQEMVDTWRETLAEVELIVQGKKLIPFWRGAAGARGVNLRRAFVELKAFDILEWIQGTGATPFLEKGEFTKLADPRVGGRLNDAFGGPLNLVGFGFWFN